MGTTLDGQAIFDEQGLTISVGCWNRVAVERAVAGLDGTMSIDLGARSRPVRQSGVLRAASRSAMHTRINAISGFIDGRTHTLKTTDKQTYGNLRVDSFNQIDERPAGPGIIVEYEIVYTQLGG